MFRYFAILAFAAAVEPGWRGGAPVVSGQARRKRLELLERNFEAAEEHPPAAGLQPGEPRASGVRGCARPCASQPNRAWPGWPGWPES